MLGAGHPHAGQGCGRKGLPRPEAQALCRTLSSPTSRCPLRGTRNLHAYAGPACALPAQAFSALEDLELGRTVVFLEADQALPLSLTRLRLGGYGDDLVHMVFTPQASRRDRGSNRTCAARTGCWAARGPLMARASMTGWLPCTFPARC